MEISTQMLKARKKNERNILTKANVLGMGVGLKETEGKLTEEPAIVVLVRNKIPVQVLPKQDIIPKTIDGIKSDVKEVGEVVALQSTTDRWRPAPGGVSAGHYAITAGTLGAWVRDAATSKPLILSNNHVMANSNDAQKGDPVLQPGPLDGGSRENDTIAELERFVQIRFPDGEENNGCSISRAIIKTLNTVASWFGSATVFSASSSAPLNEVDAAVAKPLSEEMVKQEILKIGQVSGIEKAKVDMNVKKCGRTTEFTTGKITVLDTTIQVGYGSGRVATFEHQILTSGMSQGGDSGSLVVDEENRAVGLLFAGSDQVTVLNPIDTVMRLLNISIGGVNPQ